MNDSMAVSKSHWAGEGDRSWLAASLAYCTYTTPLSPSAVAPWGAQAPQLTQEGRARYQPFFFLRHSGDFNVLQWEMPRGPHLHPNSTHFSLLPLPSPTCSFSLECHATHACRSNRPTKSRLVNFTVRGLSTGGLQFLLTPSEAAVSTGLWPLTPACSGWDGDPAGVWTELSSDAVFLKWDLKL